jgi:hypothetical protein
MDVEIFLVTRVLLCPLGDTWGPGKTTTLFPRRPIVVVFFPFCTKEDDEQRKEEAIIIIIIIE